MKKYLSIFLSIIMFIAMAGCSDSDKSSKNNSSKAEEIKGFHVDGTKLLDANGNEFVMRGVNHAHTWYKNDTPVALKAISETGANSVRIVLSDGQKWEKDDVTSVKTIIQQCKELNMIAVLEVHDPTGAISSALLERTVDYWIEIKDALIGEEKYVILNIANEWYGQWESEPWRDAYVEAVPKLREAGIKNCILIDSAGWGQYPQSVADCGKEIFESDPLKNVMFAVHFYGSAGGNQRKIRYALENIRKQGLCVCVGEFGHDHSDGDVDEDYIMEYCTEQGIGYLGWSWKGNSGGVEYLDIAVEWDGSVLSEDWGEKLINGEYGIRNTSEICSVFEN